MLQSLRSAFNERYESSGWGLLGRNNLTADKPSAEIVIVYGRASTSTCTELSSMFAPSHRKYESSIQAAKVGYCKYPLLDLAADVGHSSFVVFESNLAHQDEVGYQ